MMDQTMLPMAAASMAMLSCVLTSVLVAVQSYGQWAKSVSDMSHDERVVLGIGAALGAISMVGGAYLTCNQWG